MPCVFQSVKDRVDPDAFSSCGRVLFPPIPFPLIKWTERGCNYMQDKKLEKEKVGQISEQIGSGSPGQRALK